MAVFEAGWCPKGCGSPEEKGKKIKESGYFQHPLKLMGKISRLYGCYQFHYHSHMAGSK